jgi:magnesium transporter
MHRPHLHLPHLHRPSRHRELRARRADRSRIQPSDGLSTMDAQAIDEALTDCAVYDHGRREGGRVPLTEALDRAHRASDGFVWIGLHNPEPAAVEAVGAQFGLHPLVVEDAIQAHQRPKLERHETMFSLVMKTAEYVDETEHVEIGELMLVVGPKFVVSIRHGTPVPLHGLREDLENDRTRMERGPGAVFHAIVDRVVDEYADVLDGLVNDVDEVEAMVFSTERIDPTERIYRLKREVIAFKKAVGPLVHPLTRLVEDQDLPVPDRARPYLRDVLDHLVRDAEAVNSIDDILSGVLDANLAQISLRQSEDARKISAWAAIAVVPTMIFGLYGMNFEHMPELKWHLGYPAVLLVTLGICAELYRRLRRAGWL